MIVLGEAQEDGAQPLVALVLRGDHELNELKAEKHPLIGAPFAMASEERILAEVGANVGSIGPVGLSIPVIADRSAAALADFVCGANTDDVHYTGTNWTRDVGEYEVFDLRNVVEVIRPQMVKAKSRSNAVLKSVIFSNWVKNTPKP